MLLDRPGAVLTRAEIREELWPSQVVGDLDNGINIAVSKIRRALGDSADRPRYVRTEPRRGYRFAVTPRTVDPLPNSIAVLPLANRSRDPEQEFFADGLTDELIASLARIGSIKVISSTSSLQYKNTRKPLAQVASELGVEAILEGSVLRVDDRVRVHVQLIDAATDGHLWAESFDRELTGVLALQAEIARTVAYKIQANVTQPEADRLSGVDRVDTDSYDAYLRGMWHLHRLTPDGLHMALESFQSALGMTPDSAAAHAGVASVMTYSTVMGAVHPRQAGTQGLVEARRAIELDPKLSHGFAVLGLLEQYTRWDWEASEEAYRKAIELSPNNAFARLHYSLLLTYLRRLDEADEMIARALELNPLDIFFQHIHGMRLMFLRKHEQALEQLRGVIARAPRMQMTHLVMWVSLTALGLYDQAFEAAVRAWSVVDDQEMTAALRDGYTEGGYPSAMQNAAELLAERSQSTYVLAHVVALMYDYAGAPEDALEWIEYGYREGEHAMVHVNHTPYSDRVRSHPRFTSILQRLELPTWARD